MRLAGKRHVCPRGGARLGERGWGADAYAAEAALCVVRGVDQRPRLGLGDPHGDCTSVVADVRDLAVALVGRAVDSVVFGLAAVAPHLLGGGW